MESRKPSSQSNIFFRLEGVVLYIVVNLVSLDVEWKGLFTTPT